MNNIFQVLERKLDLVVAKANHVLDPSDSGDAITADELQSTADELQKTVKSVVSAGYPKSHPRVRQATTLGKALRDKCIKVIAVYLVSFF